MKQSIRFCTSGDDWDSPLWRHWLDGLAEGRTLVRYDERGSGLSDRDVTRFLIDAQVGDLEAVVDEAGLERFSLLGLSNAGVVQATPWKEACLGRCRTPVGLLIAEWRQGARGGLIMGIRHGVYCLGCCWALMAVLFLVGTMHLGWMAAIAVFVLVEKIAPLALRVRYTGAVVLVGWGPSVPLGGGA